MAVLLLDTKIVIAIVNGKTARLRDRLCGAINDPENELVVSVASLWEMVIKCCLGKLALTIPPGDIPAYLAGGAITLRAVDKDQVLARMIPEPDTRDPFDRLPLALCTVDTLKLVTTDAALCDHPLAY